MKYQDKTFQVGGSSKTYDYGWGITFAGLCLCPGHTSPDRLHAPDVCVCLCTLCDGCGAWVRLDAIDVHNKKCPAPRSGA